MKFDKLVAFFKKKPSKPKAFSADHTPNRASLNETNVATERPDDHKGNLTVTRFFLEQNPKQYSISAVRMTTSGLGVKIEYGIEPKKFTKAYIRLAREKIPLKYNKHGEPYHLTLKLLPNHVIQVISNDVFDILSSMKILSPDYLSPALMEQIAKHFPTLSGEIDLYNVINRPPQDEAPKPPVLEPNLPLTGSNSPIQNNSSPDFFIVPPVKPAPEPPAQDQLNYR